MPEQFPQDETINHNAVVSAYSPEMLAARDNLVSTLESLRQQLSAADALGQLPPRVGYHVYGDGTTAIDIGRFSTDANEALRQFKTDTEFAALTEATGPKNDLMVITIRGDKQAHIDEEMPLLDQPLIKIESGTTRDDGAVVNTSLSIYPDGYVEYGSEATRINRVHPPEASDAVKQFAEPRIKQEVTIEPHQSKPATVEEVHATSTNLVNLAARHDVHF